MIKKRPTNAKPASAQTLTGSDPEGSIGRGIAERGEHRTMSVRAQDAPASSRGKELAFSSFLFDCSDPARCVEFMALTPQAVKLYVALKMLAHDKPDGAVALDLKRISHFAQMKPSNASRALEDLVAARFVEAREGSIVVIKTAEQMAARRQHNGPKSAPSRPEVGKRETEKVNDIKAKKPPSNLNINLNIKESFSSDEEKAPEGWGPPTGIRARLVWEAKEIERLGSREALNRLLADRDARLAAAAQAGEDSRRAAAIEAAPLPPKRTDSETKARERMFAECVPWFEARGLDDPKARQLIGQLIKAKGGDAVEAWATMQQVMALNAGDVTYVRGVIAKCKANAKRSIRNAPDLLAQQMAH